MTQQQLALDALNAAGKKRAPITRVGKNADTYIDISTSTSDGIPHTIGQSHKSKRIDADFFSGGTGMSDRPYITGSLRPDSMGTGYTRTTLYPHQRMIGNDGRPIDEGVPVQVAVGKRHFKGKKHVKHRSGKGYD